MPKDNERVSGNYENQGRSSVVLSPQAPQSPQSTECYVTRIIYWRKPWQTAAILIGSILFQASLFFFSVIFVISWTGLLMMIMAAIFRCIYYFAPMINSNQTPTRNAITMSKSLLPHQFCGLHSCEEKCCREVSSFLSKTEFPLSEADEISHDVFTKFSLFLFAIRELILLKRPLQSIKFAILLYFLACLGKKINFLPLCLIATLLAFTIPKVIEKFQIQIVSTTIMVKKKMYHLTSQAVKRIPWLRDHFPVIEAEHQQ